jgi:hypothetical protein
MQFILDNNGFLILIRTKHFVPLAPIHLAIFVQLTFNLSNRVTDTLESKTVLLYSRKHVHLYTQNVGRMLC